MTTIKPDSKRAMATRSNHSLIIEIQAQRKLLRNLRRDVHNLTILLVCSLALAAALVVVLAMVTTPVANAQEAPVDEPTIIIAPENTIICYPLGGGMVTCF